MVSSSSSQATRTPKGAAADEARLTPRTSPPRDHPSPPPRAPKFHRPPRMKRLGTSRASTLPASSASRMSTSRPPSGARGSEPCQDLSAGVGPGPAGHGVLGASPPRSRPSLPSPPGRGVSPGRCQPSASRGTRCIARRTWACPRSRRSRTSASWSSSGTSATYSSRACDGISPPCSPPWSELGIHRNPPRPARL